MSNPPTANNSTQNDLQSEIRQTYAVLRNKHVAVDHAFNTMPTTKLYRSNPPLTKIQMYKGIRVHVIYHAPKSQGGKRHEFELSLDQFILRVPNFEAVF